MTEKYLRIVSFSVIKTFRLVPLNAGSSTNVELVESTPLTADSD